MGAFASSVSTSPQFSGHLTSCVELLFKFRCFVEKLGNSLCSRPLKTNKNHTRSDAVGFFGVSNSHTTKFSAKWQHCVKQTSNRPPPAPLPLPLPLSQPRRPLPLLPRPLPRLLPRPGGILTKKLNTSSFSVWNYCSNVSVLSRQQLARALFCRQKLGTSVCVSPVENKQLQQHEKTVF